MANCINILPKIEATVTTTPEPKASTGLVTLVPINPTTWVPLPASSIANRISLSVQNKTGQIVKLRHTTPSGWTGVELEDAEERNYNDIDPALVVYAKSETSAVDLIVEELATV